MSSQQPLPTPSFDFPLSPETISLILDLLDTPSIASFALVNRSCNVLARPSLWKNLRIPVEFTLVRLAGLEPAASTSDGRPQSTTPSPWLTLVRSLEIGYKVWSADTADWDALSTVLREVKDNVRRISLDGRASANGTPTSKLSEMLSKQTRAVECLFGTGTSYRRLRGVNIEPVWPQEDNFGRLLRAWDVGTAMESKASPPQHLPWNCTAPVLRHFGPGLSPSLEYVRPVVEQHSSTLESLAICLYDEPSPVDTAKMANLRLPRLRSLSWSFSKHPSTYLRAIHSSDTQSQGGLTHLLASRSLSHTLSILDVQSSGSIRILLAAISHCKLLTKLSFSPSPLVVPIGLPSHPLTLQYASVDWAPLITSPLSRLTHLRLVQVTPSRDDFFSMNGPSQPPPDSNSDGLVLFLYQAAPKLVELTLDGCPALFPRKLLGSSYPPFHAPIKTPTDPQILDSLLAQLSPSTKRLIVTHPAIRTTHEQSLNHRKRPPPRQSGPVRSNFNNIDAANIPRQAVRQLTLDLPPRSNISLLPTRAPNLEELDMPLARVDMSDLEVLKTSPKLRRLVLGGSGDNGNYYMLGRMQWRKDGGEWTMVECADVEIDDMV